MIASPIFAAILVQSTATAAPLPLTDVHKRDLSCVAALAIVASEQQRGVESSFVYPLIQERGKTYAGVIGERVMQETGMSQEDVGKAMVAAVADQQAKVKDVAEPQQVVEAEMAKCLPLLDETVPPKPKPNLNQCAAMVELAYREVYGREGLSKTAKDLKTLATVLDSRARDALKADGYSGNESDVILTTLREKMLAEAREKEAQGISSDLDFDHCFKLAAPKEKTPVTTELRPFHLAFPVHDLDKARSFYGGVLECEEGRSASHWIDFNLYGHQIVTHLDNKAPAAAMTNPVDGENVPVPHFGVVLTMDQWEALANKLKLHDIEFVIEPTIRFKGETGEQATMFFQDPSGNALEFKAFADDSQLFATD